MSRTGLTRIIRVRSHDERDELVLLDTAPQLADVMGRFPAARFVSHRRGAYALPVDLLDALATFARVHDVLLIDERGAAAQQLSGRVVGHARPEPECATCGQPARRERQPGYCPSCGESWHAVEHEPYAEDEQREQCARCLARQPFGFDYCQRCGCAIDHEQPSGKPVPIADAPRVQLEDPLPIGAAVDELLAQHVR